MSTRRKELREQHIFWLTALLIIFSLVLGRLLFNAANRYFSSSFDSIADSSSNLEHEFDEIRFSYPASWIMFETPSGNHGDMNVIAVLSPAFESLPVIEVRKREFESTNLNLVVSWAESRIISKNEYNNLPLEKFNSNGLSGLTMMYTYKVENPLEPYTCKCKDLYLSQKGKGYIFSICSDEAEWNQYNPVFEEILYSIKPLN